jgi:protoporphyrinogen oxidase
MEKGKKTQLPWVIIGGGVTGLATAWKLAAADKPIIVIEKNSVVGGMAGTFKYKEYELDYGPHKIYSQLPIFEEVKEFLSKDLLTVKKTSKIRLRGKYLRYPFGTLDLFKTLGIWVGFKCGFSYATTSFLNNFRTIHDTSYEDYITNRFGAETYNLVLGPYAEKAWDNPKNLDKSLAATRVAIPSLSEMVKRMIFGDQGKNELSAALFYYPAKGAVEMAQKMIEVIEEKGNKIILNATPTKIDINTKNKEATSITYKDDKGKTQTIKIAGIVSTIPMRALLTLFQNKGDKEGETKEKQRKEDAQNAVDKLKFRKLMLLYIEVNKDRLFPENWIFNRLSEQKGFSEHMIPKGKTILCAEMTFAQDDPRTKLSDKELLDLVVPQLEECDILKKEEIESYFSKTLRDGYPIYHVNYKEDVELYLTFIEEYKNLFSIGRQGMFNYVGTIDCIDMGATTAAFIKSEEQKEKWKQERKKFENYVTID